MYTKPWPVANDNPGYIGDGSYLDLHPTRYDWEPQIEKWIRYIIGKYGVWANTYYDHPPEEEAPGLFDRVSVDFWAWDGRGFYLPRDKGAAIWKELFYSLDSPQIDWIIYEGYIWSRHTRTWVPFGHNDFTWHFDHIHITFVPGTGGEPPTEGVPIPPPPPPLVGKTFDAEMLQKCMYGLSKVEADYYLPYLVKTLNKHHINTRERISAFLGQTGHESGSLKFWEEIGGPSKPYAPYYGRGPMQLTHDYNYEAFAKWSGYDAHSNPRIVANDTQVGLDAAGWFWEIHEGFDLNTLADKATWESYDQITRIINGGFNGKEDRDNRYTAAWNAIPEGVVLEPKPEPDPVPVPEPEPEPDMKDAWIGFTGDDEQWMRTGGPVPRGSWVKLVPLENGNYSLELVTPEKAPPTPDDPDEPTPGPDPIDKGDTIEFSGEGKRLKLKGVMKIEGKE